MEQIHIHLMLETLDHECQIKYLNTGIAFRNVKEFLDRPEKRYLEKLFGSIRIWRSFSCMHEMKSYFFMIFFNSVRANLFHTNAHAALCI